MQDTRNIPTSVLEVGASERDLSSFKTANGEIIADEGSCK